MIISHRPPREQLATSQLYAAIKAGKPWAICFFLKARCGRRETADPAAVNVNVDIDARWASSLQVSAQRIEEQKRVIRSLTEPERRQYLELMNKARERLRVQKPAAVEVPARIVDREPPEGGIAINNAFSVTRLSLWNKKI